MSALIGLQCHLCKSVFPAEATSGDTEGWFYLNLNNSGSPMYSVARAPDGTARIFATGMTRVRQSQNWVISSIVKPTAIALRITRTRAIADCGKRRPR